MGQQYDPRSVFTAMHHEVTSELLRLMDGFYSNIEDGLFELAYRNNDEAQQCKCFDLMREMRFRRSNLIQTFARRMQRTIQYWFNDSVPYDEHNTELEIVAKRMSEKCSAHFKYLLQNIAERTAYGTGRDVKNVQLPISPYSIAYQFVCSCRSLQFDRESIQIVQELFARFVLDRLGGVYGDCNQRLDDAGYSTLEEGQGTTIISA